VPGGDHETLRHLEDIGGKVEHLGSSGTGDLACLRQFLFNTDLPPVERSADGSLEFFSAPGRAGKSVEMAGVSSVRRAPVFASMRWRSSCAPSQLSWSPRARARLRQGAGLVRPGHSPAAPGRPCLLALLASPEQPSASRLPSLRSARFPRREHDELAGRVEDGFGRTSDSVMTRQTSSSGGRRQGSR
jgi:hypothetical protein